MYLLDTSVILELLLDQEQADDVERLLREAGARHLHLSEFALYSLGIVLMRRNRYDAFLQIVDELLVRRRVRLIRLGIRDMKRIVDACQSYNLDFDDAYQYAAAEKRDLLIVSFDKDFDRTPRGRKTPAEAMAS